MSWDLGVVAHTRKSSYSRDRDGLQFKASSGSKLTRTHVHQQTGLGDDACDPVQKHNTLPEKQLKAKWMQHVASGRALGLQAEVSEFKSQYCQTKVHQM
jgi:hypothetical protein